MSTELDSESDEDRQLILEESDLRERRKLADEIAPNVNDILKKFDPNGKVERISYKPYRGWDNDEKGHTWHFGVGYLHVEPRLKVIIVRIKRDSSGYYLDVGIGKSQGGPRSFWWDYDRNEISGLLEDLKRATNMRVRSDFDEKFS